MVAKLIVNFVQLSPVVSDQIMAELSGSGVTTQVVVIGQDSVLS
jgi:hypothetical protein